MAAGWTFSTSALILCLMGFARAQDDVREPPKIIEPLFPEQKVYQLEDDVILKCKATGQPDPKYHWYWNGAPVKSDGVMTIDISTGDLVINKLSTREEGFYNCWAKTVFPNETSAAAISPKIEVRVARIDPWKTELDTNTHATQGRYLRIECKNQPHHYGPTILQWFTIEPFGNKGRELTQDERIFIDDKGTLHFAHVLASDEAPGRMYACAMFNIMAGQTEVGDRTWLTVNTSSPVTELQPIIPHYWTGKDNSSDLTFVRNTQGRLECVFSGFVNDVEGSTITWRNSAGNTIASGQDRYAIRNYGRVLLIDHLVEADEAFTCIGKNEFGSAEKTLYLNVTSPPIWVNPLTSKTVPQGEDAEFTCEARSVSGEADPNPPRWFRNGQRLDETYDKHKYKFEEEKQKLTVLSPQKDEDIACYQCFVSNSVGESVSDGCLNVLLPVEITTQPDAEQSIEKGDIVNLTVVATSDPLYALSYKWIFKNVTYEANDVPPHVIYDSITKVAYINTSYLTHEQVLEIKGTYRREIYHQFQKKHVDVEVTLRDEPKVMPLKKTGFDYWIIGLIIGILIISIVFLIICFVICRDKMLEGHYPVDRKERTIGLDPEKELKDSGFLDWS